MQFLEDAPSVVSNVTVSILNSCIEREDVSEALEELDQNELQHIQKVMVEDREVRKKELERRNTLRAKTLSMEKDRELKNIDDGEKFCLDCSEKFKTLILPKIVCSLCLKGVCKNCIKFKNNNFVTCVMCYENSLYKGMSGEWFNALAKENQRLRRSASAVFNHSIKKLKRKFNNETTNVELNRTQSLQRNTTDGVDANKGKYQPIYTGRSSLKQNSQTLNGDINRGDPDNNETFSKPREVCVDRLDSTSQSQNENVKPEPVPRQYSNLQAMSSMSGSMLSVYSETDESYNHKLQVSGEINLSVSYNNENQTLDVYIDQCRNIAVADSKRRTTDSYIKTYLLPDKTKISKKKSTIKKKSLNPVFKETLSYGISKEEATKRTLSVAIWHKSSVFSYNLFLGEIHLLLEEEQLENNEVKWYPFQHKLKYPTRVGFINKGELIFELSYKSSSLKNGKGTLLVKIIEAKRLVSESRNTNAYVKGFLLPDRSSKGKRKTPVAKQQTSPTWNYLLQFENVKFEELKDRSLELSVMHKRSMQAPEFLGGLRLNLGLHVFEHTYAPWMDSGEQEKETWSALLNNQLETTKAIIQLRPNLDC